MVTKIVRRKSAEVPVIAVEAAVPMAYVESPIETVLASARRIVAAELAYMERAQFHPDSGAPIPMSPADSKKFSNLMGALERAVTIGDSFSKRELAEMDDATLENELLAELERVRARRIKARA